MLHKRKSDSRAKLHRPLAIVLTSGLLLSMIPFTGITAAAGGGPAPVTEGYIGDASNVLSTTDDNSGNGWMWDSADKKLTLYGVSLNKSDSAPLKLPDNSQIELQGYNKISCDGYYSAVKGNGITIDGSGMLELKGTTSGVISMSSGSLTINGGYILAAQTEATDEHTISANAININGGYLVVDGTNTTYAAVNASDFTMTGGNVNAISANNSALSVTHTTTINGGFLQLENKSGSGMSAFYTNSGTFVNNGGVVTATANGDDSTGLCAEFGNCEFNGGVTVAKGTVQAVKTSNVSGSELFWNNAEYTMSGDGSSLDGISGTSVAIAKTINAKDSAIIDGCYYRSTSYVSYGSDVTIGGGNYFEIDCYDSTAVTLNDTVVEDNATFVSVNKGYNRGNDTTGIYVKSGTVPAGATLIGVSEEGENGVKLKDTVTVYGNIFDSHDEAYSDADATFMPGSSFIGLNGQAVIGGTVEGGNFTGYNGLVFDDNCVVNDGSFSSYAIMQVWENAHFNAGTFAACGAEPYASLIGAVMTVSETCNFTDFTMLGATALGENFGSVSYGIVYADEYYGFLAGDKPAGVVYVTKPSKPTITVAKQADTLVTGTAGSTTLKVTPKNFTLEKFEPQIQWVTENHDGVSLSLNNNVVTANITENVNAGDYKFKIVSGGIESSAATVKVDKKSATDSMKNAYANALNIGKDGINATVPKLPNGATYGTAICSGDIPLTFVDINDTTLTFNAAASTAGQTGTITIPVTGATNYEDYSLVLTVTSIAKTEVTINATAADKLLYNGKAQKGYTGDITVSDNLVPVSALVIKYEGTNLTEYSATANAPVNAGTYRLTISVADTNEDYAGSKIIEFSIDKKDITVNAAVKDKFYDGNTNAELNGTPSLNGVVTGEEVALVNGVPTFVSAEIADDIQIEFTAFSITGKDIANYNLVQPTGVTASIKKYVAQKGVDYTVNSNDWQNIDFVVTANQGFKLSATNGVDTVWQDALTATDETDSGELAFYVKNTATGAISEVVTESYKIDKTVPAGSISLGENSWNEFLNTITFDLFFKETKTVSITSDDSLSGVAKVEYTCSSTQLTLEDIKAFADWTDGSTVNVKAEDAKQLIYYAKITDNAGNVTYLSTDGFEFDTTSPAIVGIKNGATYYTTQKVTATDKNMAAVTLNGKAAETSITLDGNTDVVYTVCATDKAGNTTVYTVTMKPIATLATAINSITAANVKSSDKPAISTVKSNTAVVDIQNATQAEKGELKAITDNCDALLAVIAGTSTEIDRINGAVGAYNVETVKSTDKADIEKLVADIDALTTNKGNNLTEAEKAELEAIKTIANGLLAQIANAYDATTVADITAVLSITKDNAKISDREALAKAKSALETAISQFEGNYTEEELTALKAKLTVVTEALALVDNAKNVVNAIVELPLPEAVKESDRDAINSAKQAYDALTQAEKALIDTEYVTKLNADVTALKKLGKTPVTTQPQTTAKVEPTTQQAVNAPQTGVANNMLLTTLLLTSLLAFAVLCIVAKKRKQK